MSTKLHFSSFPRSFIRWTAPFVSFFSRHKDVRVIERYDDNRLDLAGDVARKVAASVSDETLSA